MIIHLVDQGGSNDKVHRILGDFEEVYRGFDADSEDREGPNEATRVSRNFLSGV